MARRTARVEAGDRRWFGYDPDVDSLRYGPNSAEVQRLLDDGRVLGPSGIERIAWAWRRYATHELGALDDADKAALEMVRKDGLEAAWAAAEQDLRAMTEGHHAQAAWRAEPPNVDRTAEDAALHAALALVAGPQLDGDHYRALVKPMSEALPWLLPAERPDEYRERRH
ncbi:MAG TPA: hypothetical protein VIA06_20895 [Candidatus Dormibacteraeota bacterium]|jgi:hypothetical protein|nr:hypothetical protein [Candidatus Dormibacteraeota bacterium]